jgi:hypothetical protein
LALIWPQCERTGPDAADQIQPVSVGRVQIALQDRLGIQRQKEIGRIVAQRIAKETGRSDSHHGKWLVIQVEDATDNGRIGIVLLLPQAVAHDDDRRRAGLVIRGRERASSISCDAEHGEVIAGYELSRITAGRLRAARPPDAEQRLECREGC